MRHVLHQCLIVHMYTADTDTWGFVCYRCRWMMRDLYNALPLPDDRPITSICVVEELIGCPPNYTAVSRFLCGNTLNDFG